MVTIACLADTHADEHNRWDEHCRTMQWIAKDLGERHPDLVIHCGDLYDGASTPTERAFVADWVQTIADFAQIIVVAGNHDRTAIDGAGDIGILNRLRARHRIVAIERPEIVHICLEDGGQVAVACLPWPRLANLLATTGPIAPESANAAAVESLRSILISMGQQMRSHGDATMRILACHAMIEGSRTDSRQPLVGVDLTVSIADLQLAGADFIVAGHVHAEQNFGPRALYCGAPYHRTFGEPGPCSYSIIHKSSVVRVPVPARPMLLLETEWADGQLAPIDLSGVRGAECRLRYRVDADQHDAARQRLYELRDRMLADGAAMVKLDPVVRATTRARLPEIATALRLPDKLRVLLKSRGIELGGREPRILSRLAQLEAEWAMTEMNADIKHPDAQVRWKGVAG